MSLEKMTFDDFCEHMSHADADLSTVDNVTTAVMNFVGKRTVAGYYHHDTGVADLCFA